jgi:hypothetical protein
MNDIVIELFPYAGMLFALANITYKIERFGKYIISFRRRQ